MVFIAFGITGDHMRLKILPALYMLHRRGGLGGMRVIGVSRKNWSNEDLRAYVATLLPDAAEDFISKFSFAQGDVGDASSFTALTGAIGGEPTLVYLSISPRLFAPALQNLESMGLPMGSRLMVEKPLGRSGAEAERLWAHLTRIVDEKSIFLVDHFLAKDWIRELRPEPMRRIELRYLETLGVEGRGEAYDSLGALRDVLQNHLLQALARLLGQGALEELPRKAQCMRAQYEGFRTISGVAQGSQTETYCKVSFAVRGIDITLEVGKRMPQMRKEASVTCADGTVKVFSDRPNTTPEYELLLGAALCGEHELFVPIEDVRAQWRFADSIIDTWQSGSVPLLAYEPGTFPQFS